MKYKVIDPGVARTTFNISNITNDTDHIIRYSYGHPLIDGTVVRILEETSNGICIVEDYNSVNLGTVDNIKRVFIIDKEGLEKVEEVLPCPICGDEPSVTLEPCGELRIACSRSSHTIELRGLNAKFCWQKLTRNYNS